MHHEFATPRPLDVDVMNGAGRVEITAADLTETTVDVDCRNRQVADETRVELSPDGSHLVIRPPERQFRSTPAISITAAVPAGSRVRSKTGSADLRTRGRLAALDAATGSGDTDVDEVDGDVAVRSGSGDLSVGRAGGRVSLKTGSGGLRVGRAGSVQASAGSGDIGVGEVANTIDAHTASGDVTVESVRAGTTAVQTASGDVRIGVAAGAVARLDISTVTGEPRSELPVDDVAPAGGSALDVRVHTVTGDITIARAVPVG